MQDVKIYTKSHCPYCSAAKALLNKKGAEFEEVDVTQNPSELSRLSKMAGGRSSVPQIWIGQTHVGGFDDLCELDADSKLDRLLAGRAAK